MAEQMVGADMIPPQASGRKPKGPHGCLTVLGISARHVVVGLDGIEGGADHRLQTFETGAGVQREPRADLRAGVGERIE